VKRKTAFAAGFRTARDDSLSRFRCYFGCSLLAYRELDDALGLSESASDRLADARTGKNGRHALVGMLRQSVFGRLAGYEDVNDGRTVAARSGYALDHRR